MADCGCHGVGDCGCHGVADCGCHGVAEWKWKVPTTAIKTIVIHHLSLLLVCYIIEIGLRILHK